MGAPRGTVRERFERFFTRGAPDECWLWTGGISRAGYGTFTVSTTRREFAHRVAYELFIGPIPEGLTIDHVRARGCTSTACVNPDHLEAVTQGENTMRSPTSSSGINIRKTHCPRGHAYNQTLANGWRRCRTCDAASEKRRNERRRAQRALRRAA